MVKAHEVMRSNLKRILKEKKISQMELAKKTGMKQSYISMILTGQRNLGSKTIKRICSALNIKEDDLLRQDTLDIPNRLYGPIPVISWVQAGEFKEAVDLSAWGSEEVVYSVKKVSPRAFALRVEGDSMAPRFLPGDIIIVDPEVMPQPWDFCIAWLNGEVTLKKFYENDKEIRLIPLNEKYPVIVIEKDKPVDFRLIGKVVDFIGKL